MGLVARWGAEEFPLVFDHMSVDDAVGSLQNLLDKIRNLEVSYHEETIHITMTFGLVNGDSADIKQLLKTADERLYQGKSNGRNQIVL